MVRASRIYLRFGFLFLIVVVTLLTYHLYLRSRLPGADWERQIYNAHAGTTSELKGPISYAIDVFIPMSLLTVVSAVTFRAHKDWWTNFAAFLLAFVISTSTLASLGALWLRWQPWPAWYHYGSTITRGPDLSSAVFFFCVGIIFCIMADWGSHELEARDRKLL
jgi:hypothetical protein